jgi:hypothetical protein
VEVKILVKSVEATRIGEGNKDSNVIFNVNVLIEEALKVPGQLKVQFNIEMESDPKIGSIIAIGDATFTAEDTVIDGLLEVKAKQTELPTVFQEIYKRLYPIFYLLANSVDLPYPAPDLIRNTTVSSAPVKTEQGVETPPEGPPTPAAEAKKP